MRTVRQQGNGYLAAMSELHAGAPPLQLMKISVSEEQQEAADEEMQRQFGDDVYKLITSNEGKANYWVPHQEKSAQRSELKKK